MLTRALYLSCGWLILCFLITLLRGTRLKKGNAFRSILWLATVLLCGDLWALLTFGVPYEVIGLSAITFIAGCWWIWRLPNWNGLGQSLWITSLLTTILYLAYSFAITAFTPLHPLAFIITLGLTFVETLALLLALTYAYESLDVCCRIRWKRRFKPMTAIPGYMPKVSLHVPAYNEPPEVVEATLRSLAQLDYPNFEVLLIDNNTPDETVWHPLEKLCQELGPRFRFLHLDKWPGYKSGALNFAMTQTSPDTEIIGIIDADYRVSPHFLRDMTPYFSDSRVAFVQTPQDYRDFQGNSYLEACHDGYKYFFAVSMPSRNEHNAIIFAGTMGLIRKSALQEIGGWDEWCITEDAEASLRVLKRGYQTVFVNKSYGTGLMPYTFDGLKKQRFRWCFGGIQILKKHWESLLPWSGWLDPENRLTWAQRYYYFVGGLQWFNEPLNLLFTIFLIIGAVIHFSPARGIIRPLTGPLIIIPIVFLLVGIWRFLWVLKHTLKLTTKDAIRAMANFFSLGWTVMLACIQGLIQPAGVFMRTPKSRSNSGIIRAVRAAQWETLIGLLCIGLAVGVNLVKPQPTTLFLGGLLIWQGALYLTALYYSLYSMRDYTPQPAAEYYGTNIKENRLAQWAMVPIFAVVVVVAVSLLLPPPSTPPDYTRLQPKDIPVQQLVGLPPPTEQPTLIITPTLTTPQPGISPTSLTATIVNPSATSSATSEATSLATETPLPTETPVAATPTEPAPTAQPTLAATSTPAPTQPIPTLTEVTPNALPSPTPG